MHDETNPRDPQLERLAKAIKGIRIAMLTTIDESGILHSRPMATLDIDFDGDLWFFTYGDSGKVLSIAGDWHVNLAYADTDSHRYVSISGRCRLVNDRAKIEELWSPAMKMWFPEGIDDPKLALLQVSVESADIWDSPSGAFVKLVGLAKAMLTGQVYDTSPHIDHLVLHH